MGDPGPAPFSRNGVRKELGSAGPGWLPGTICESLIVVSSFLGRATAYVAMFALGLLTPFDVGADFASLGLVGLVGSAGLEFCASLAAFASCMAFDSRMRSSVESACVICAIFAGFDRSDVPSSVKSVGNIESAAAAEPLVFSTRLAAIIGRSETALPTS